MAEKDQRRRVIRSLAGMDPIPVENPALPGTPDVNCTVGWIELKWIRTWPKRTDTAVKIDHYTPQQRIFLKRRWRTNRGSWLLLQVRKEWLLFEGNVAAAVVGRATRDELRSNALKLWDDGLHAKELQTCLRTSHRQRAKRS